MISPRIDMVFKDWTSCGTFSDQQPPEGKYCLLSSCCFVGPVKSFFPRELILHFLLLPEDTGFSALSAWRNATKSTSFSAINSPVGKNLDFAWSYPMFSIQLFIQQRKVLIPSMKRVWAVLACTAADGQSPERTWSGRDGPDCLEPSSHNWSNSL